ncbi:PilN domain-containing protein [Candidatus Nomurabacteria bacterium]|nr:PilN domain-containing protein [Candidatus Nomurabacteria bacterium]
MINLLPTQAKKVVKREYSLRLLAVFSLSLSFACLVLLMMSIPTWLMLSYQTIGEDKDQTLLNEIAKDRAHAEQELSETQRIIEHLSQRPSSLSHTAIIESLDQLGGKGVTINQFIFDTKGKLTLTGIASTRATLSSFRDRIEESKDFKSVDLPLSSLVQESEAAFTMTVTLK